jgi:hypothetical protein
MVNEENKHTVTNYQRQIHDTVRYHIYKKTLFRIRNPAGKNDLQKNEDISCSEVLEVLFEGLEASPVSCNLKVLHGGPRINTVPVPYRYVPYFQ